MASITQLEYLLAVDQCRHFGRASELCHVSQPTLSTQIQKLEDELDVVLFDRHKQPILPTEEGRALIEQARTVVNEHRRLLMMAQRKTETLEGEFKLAVIPTVAPYIVPGLVREFNKTYPKIELAIEEMPTAAILESLDRETLDAAIIATPLGLTRLEEEVLFYEPMFLFVSEKHPYSSLKKVSEEMLKPEDLWLPSDEHCLREQVLSVCQAGEASGCFPSIHLRGGSLTTIIEMVENEAGYALLPQLAAEKVSQRKYRGQVLEMSRPAPAREISLVHRRGYLKQGILKALRQCLDLSLPKALPRERSKSFHVVGLEGKFR